jgi:hypothetical protein
MCATRCSTAVSKAQLNFGSEPMNWAWKGCDDRDLDQFLFEFQTTSVKLAGALSGLARGHDYRDNAFTVAYLKRALDHLHKAQAGLEAVAPKNLLPNETLTEARQKLLEIRQGILTLMEEFRRELGGKG